MLFSRIASGRFRSRSPDARMPVKSSSRNRPPRGCRQTPLTTCEEKFAKSNTNRGCRETPRRRKPLLLSRYDGAPPMTKNSLLNASLQSPQPRLERGTSRRIINVEHSGLTVTIYRFTTELMRQSGSSLRHTCKSAPVLMRSPCLRFPHLDANDDASRVQLSPPDGSVCFTTPPVNNPCKFTVCGSSLCRWITISQSPTGWIIPHCAMFYVCPAC